MLDPCSSAPDGSLRRLILGAAFVAGLAVALAPRVPDVRAADLGPQIVVQADPSSDKAAGSKAATPASKGTGASPVTPDAKAEAGTKDARPDAAAKGATSESKDDDSDAADEEDDDADSAAAPAQKRHSAGSEIIIEKGGKHVRVQGFGRDREYDSFEQFVQDAPWLAGLVFVIVLCIFHVPLLIIVLLVWYKLRKNRLANETMLKLAERGVVTPAAAMDAVASGNAAAAAASIAPASMPAYEHARLLRRRVVWSDLRKGVILTGIGFGLSAFSMFDDGTPNSVGLVFLFVGIGYCLLWFLEDRKGEPGGGSSGTPPAGGA
jgi:hypothetical protein